MEKAKVYTTNLRTYGTTSLLDKLERLDVYKRQGDHTVGHIAV